MVRYDAAIADAMMVNVTAQKELESLEIFEAERGRVAFRLDVPQEVLNYHGTIHGGFWRRCARSPQAWPRIRAA